MDDITFRTLLWIGGILVTCLIALVTYVWKTGQAEIKALKIMVAQQNKRIEDVDVRIAKIETKCSQHDKTVPLTADDIRVIIKEEFSSFKDALKLSLIEDGYIKPQQSNKGRKVKP